MIQPNKHQRGVALVWVAFALFAGFPAGACAQQDPTQTLGSESEEPGGQPIGVGAYLDPAAPLSTFRLRYSAGYASNRPDRAEFFYAQYRQQTTGSLISGLPIYVNTTPASGNVINVSGGGRGGPGPNRGRNDVVTITQAGAVVGNPDARGLRQAETRVDFQDVSSYLEYAVSNRFSGFVEAPVRFLNPQVNEDVVGLSDMNTGFKWAFLYERDLVASFQLRAYVPTGASTRGLGTHHVSLEPSLLFYSRPTDRIVFEGQASAWVPVAGTDFEGNILNYGLSLAYLAYQSQDTRFEVYPVAEAVGWTVLNGKETASLGGNFFQIRTAGGDSIFNLKLGVRVRYDHADFYVGYGTPLTGEVWYNNFLRAEFRIFF